jgi:hypothetical protein
MLASQLGLDCALALGLVVLKFVQPPLERPLDRVHLALALADGELELMLFVAQTRDFVPIGHVPMIGIDAVCVHPGKAAGRLAVRRRAAS